MWIMKRVDDSVNCVKYVAIPIAPPTTLTKAIIEVDIVLILFIK